MPSSRAISWQLLALYALPAFALAIPTIPVYVYLPTFYAESLGLGLSVTGGVLLLARVADVFTDPLIGIASDRMPSRWGHRKPWIAIGAILCGWALVQLLIPVNSVSAGYLALWAVLLYLGWTMVAIPYTAWGAELSNDYHQRARITGAREAAMIFGILIAGSLPAGAAALGWTERDGLAAAAWLAIGVGVPTIALLLWCVPDAKLRTVPGHQSIKPQQKKSFWISLRPILSNAPFVRLLSGWFINGLANGIPAVLFPLYLQYGLQVGPAQRGILIGVYFFSGILAIPGWVWLSRRWSKHRVWCAAMMLACLAFIWVPLLNPGDFVLFLAVCVVTGCALGADLSLPPAMQADVVEFDTLKSGHHRAGLFFALWSMGTKLALACAVGFSFPVLEVFGFQPGQANQASALFALVVIYALVPTVLKVGAIVLIWGHPLTERRQSIIRRRLASRNHLSERGMVQ